MKKADLLKKIAEDAGISQAQAGAALESFTDAIVTTLKTDGKLGMLGFGTFTLKHLPERMVYNPSAGEKVKAKAKNVIKFKPGKGLVDKVQ